MKDHWQPRLIDILAYVLEILVFIFAPWLDSKNSNITFSPFFFFNVSFCLWCLCFCCVDNNNFYMSCGIILVMFFGPKLQLNLKNMDMKCEVRIQRLWTIFKNYGQNGWVCMSFANMYTNETLFARRCVRVPRTEDQTWSFVLLNLHTKLSFSYSPSTKSCKQSHRITAISQWVYKPLPCVTWSNNCM
jgi:hypothetical protein